MYIPKVKAKWIPAEEYAAKKKANRESQKERKNDLEEQRIIKRIVNDIFKNVIKKHREERIKQLREATYIRPSIRFIDGEKIQTCKFVKSSLQIQQTRIICSW